MEKVRIGNDIEVKYTVLRDGQPETFVGATDIAVNVKNEAYGKIVPSTFSIVGNIVNIMLDAADCVLCGKHRVTLSYNRGNDITIDALAFELVQFTSQTGGTEIVGVELVTVNISGDIGIAIPDNNKIDFDGLNSNIDKLHFKPDTLVALAEVGDVRYSPESKTLEVKVSDTVSIQLGQEMQTRVKNDTGVQINNGQMVYINSAAGANPLAKIASTTDANIAQRTFGMATENIESNGFGAITTEGLVRDVNTASFTEGDMLWLGVNGTVTNIEPVAPTPKISVGMVLRSNVNSGVIYVKIRAIARNQKLSDVYAPTLTGGDVLRWNSTTLRFETFNVTTALAGKADLVGGKIPTSQLPAYVDDVLEYANLAAFPATGETGKIYVALDTNLTYRWSGTAYVEISKSLALGETSSTAYRGDRGKTAYDHSQATGNVHGTTASQIPNTPAGTVAATTVQGAINELAGDIVQLETDLNTCVEPLEMLDVSSSQPEDVSQITLVERAYLHALVLTDYEYNYINKITISILNDSTITIGYIIEGVGQTILYSTTALKGMPTITFPQITKPDGSYFFVSAYSSSLQTFRKYTITGKTVDMLSSANSTIITISAFQNYYVYIQAFATLTSISYLKERTSKNESDISSINNSIIESTRMIDKLLSDKYYKKTIGFIGDSYFAGVDYAIEKNKGNRTKNAFEAKHPNAVVVDKSRSGSTIKIGIASMANEFVNEYPITHTNTEIDWTVSAGYSFIQGVVLNGVTKANDIRFRYKYNSGKVWARLVLSSWNPTTKINTDLKIVNVNKVEVYDSNHPTDTFIWQFISDTPFQALDGEYLCIRIASVGIPSDYGGKICYSTNVGSFIDINGVNVTGTPVIDASLNQLDYLIMEGGLNDMYGSYPIGTPIVGYDSWSGLSSPTTFYESLEYMIGNVVTNLYRTKACFVIMPQMNRSNWNDQYILAIKAVCDKWDVPYIDLNSIFATRLTHMQNTPISKDFWSFYSNDGRWNEHPSNWGYKQMNDKIFAFIDGL